MVYSKGRDFLEELLSSCRAEEVAEMFRMCGGKVIYKRKLQTLSTDSAMTTGMDPVGAEDSTAHRTLAQGEVDPGWILGIPKECPEHHQK